MINDERPACRICGKPATQMHGTLEHPIYTCDEHAEQVMMELLSFLVEED